MSYQHHQRSYVVLALALVVIAVVGVIAAATGSVASLAVIAAIAVLLIILGLMFSELTVTVTDTEVVAAFAWGRPRRVIELDHVDAVRQVRNHWYHGWGVRWIPNGSMYNVAGLDAVELELSTGKVFRIGTDDPEPLARALGAGLSVSD